MSARIIARRAWSRAVPLAVCSLLLGAPPAALAGDCADAACVADPKARAVTRHHGTAVRWYDDGDEAARIARETGRLLFVMHIAGELPDSGLT